MKPGLLLIACAGLAASNAPAAAAPARDGPACSKSATRSAGAAVRAARAELLATPLEADDTLVPPATSGRIERLKDRLRAFVRAEMACAPAPAGPGALAAGMAARGDGLVEGAPFDPDPAPPDRHGNLLTYSVSSVGSHPDMLAVVATLGIKCGSDSMLMLYRRMAAGWSETMVLRSEPYGEVRGGWQDLRFAVSPADAHGHWFVATASTTPWCTSAWQSMPYQLARPGAAPDRPRILFRGKNGIYLGNEADLLLKAERDAFEIRNDGASLDSDILVRRHVRRYSVAGEIVRRVQPVAESVRDFADEWINAPWAEAKSWSGPDPALAGAHRALQAARFETLRGFDSVRACSGDSNEVQLDDRSGPNWFLLVRGGVDGPWILERAARRSAKGCTGPDGLPR